MKKRYNISIDSFRDLRNTKVPFFLGKKITYFGIGLYLTQKLSFFLVEYYFYIYDKELQKAICGLSTIIFYSGLFLIAIAILRFMSKLYEILVEVTEDVF